MKREILYPLIIRRLYRQHIKKIYCPHNRRIIYDLYQITYDLINPFVQTDVLELQPLRAGSASYVHTLIKKCMLCQGH